MGSIRLKVHNNNRNKLIGLPEELIPMSCQLMWAIRSLERTRLLGVIRKRWRSLWSPPTSFLMLKCSMLTRPPSLTWMSRRKPWPMKSSTVIKNYRISISKGVPRSITHHKIKVLPSIWSGPPEETEVKESPKPKEGKKRSRTCQGNKKESRGLRRWSRRRGLIHRQIVI